jgi:hypothetical protein
VRVHCHTEVLERVEKALGEGVGWTGADAVVGEADVVGGEDYGESICRHCS